MIVMAVMKDIGNRLDTINPLRVHPYEADEISVPAGLISLPTLINYQTTYGSGVNTMTLDITVLVTKVDDRIRLEQIAPYADSEGPKAIAQVLETGTYSAFDSIQVLSSRFAIVNIAGDDYLACIFSVEVIGTGRH